MTYLKMVLFALMVALETVIDWIRTFIRRWIVDTCVDKIYSISVVVGSGECNAKCRHCGGRFLRPGALSGVQGTIKGLESAIILCKQYGGWAISLTSSGEPLMSPDAVTETLREIDRLKRMGYGMAFVNLFTNGFLLTDQRIREHYLPLWKSLGLTAVAISIHDVDYARNRECYNVADEVAIPTLAEMVGAVKDAGLVPRITLLLHRGYCDNPVDYQRNLDALRDLGVYMVTSWAMCKPNGEWNQYSPSRWNLFRIRFFLWANCPRVFNQIWGGGVYNYHGLSARLTTYVSEHKPTNNFIRQLVVFQDGTVAYSWFQEGNFCLKG
ncbi:MAG: hypothetical protein PHT12_00735 [Patescibacteria group bacterium]|nr:hypothetical protein [Patescibacteria group bacterium]